MTINMNKLAFNDDDIKKKIINGSRAMQDLYNTIRNLEYQQHFEVGQILVCRYIGKENWKKDQLNKLELNNSGAVQKYIVANKLPGNLVLCRKLGVDGRPGKGIHTLANINYESYRFEEDPDIADAILLDFDYDPMLMPKLIGKARRMRQNFNNKINIECLAKRELDTSYVNDDDLVNFLKNHAKDKCTSIWGMNDSFQKQQYIVKSISKDEVKLKNIRTGTNIIKRPYDMRGRYTDQYFISEPMTQEEAMLKVKSK